MTASKRYFIILFALTILSLTGCSETKTSDAIKTFKYWVGTNPPADIEIFNGVYWQSGHWTKEYILYLKIRPSKFWWDEFIKQNSLKVDTSEWTKPDNAPIWFAPTEISKQYSQPGSSQGERYFQDTSTGVCYIYEIQF